MKHTIYSISCNEPCWCRHVFDGAGNPLVLGGAHRWRHRSRGLAYPEVWANWVRTMLLGSAACKSIRSTPAVSLTLASKRLPAQIHLIIYKLTR